MASTPKPVRKAIKKVVHKSHERAKKDADIVPYSKHHERKKDKSQVKRLKEAHQKKHAVFSEGKLVKSLMK